MKKTPSPAFKKLTRDRQMGCLFAEMQRTHCLVSKHQPGEGGVTGEVTLALSFTG